MASRKQVEEMLLLSFIHGFISEEEFGVLHEALQTKNPIFPHSDYERFTLDTLEESEIFAEFRVRKRDIERLADALGFPESFVCHQRTRADNWRTLYGAQTSGVPVQVEWSHTPVWASCARTIYDHKRGARIHLPKPPPQISTVECYSSKPTETSAVCWCRGSESFSTEKLLRASDSSITVRPISRPSENQKKNVQWSQKAPYPKVSVLYAAGWANCASFWTCW